MTDFGIFVTEAKSLIVNKADYDRFVEGLMSVDGHKLSHKLASKNRAPKSAESLNKCQQDVDKKCHKFIDDFDFLRRVDGLMHSNLVSQGKGLLIKMLLMQIDLLKEGQYDLIRDIFKRYIGNHTRLYGGHWIKHSDQVPLPILTDMLTNKRKM